VLGKRDSQNISILGGSSEQRTMSSLCHHNVITNVIINDDKIATFATFLCKFCEKKFSSRQCKSRHELKYCKLKFANKDIIIESLHDERVELKGLIENMLVEMSDLKKQVKENTKKTIIKNNKINIDNTTNIQINNFGSENLDYITDKVWKRLMSMPISGIANLVKYKHFDPKHPENHNIRITNKKLKFGEIVKNNKWELQNKKDILELLTDFTILDFKNYREDNENKLDETTILKLDKMEEINENTNRKQRQIERVELVVLNESKIMEKNKEIII